MGGNHKKRRINKTEVEINRGKRNGNGYSDISIDGL